LFHSSKFSLYNFNANFYLIDITEIRGFALMIKGKIFLTFNEPIFFFLDFKVEFYSLNEDDKLNLFTNFNIIKFIKNSTILSCCPETSGSASIDS